MFRISRKAPIYGMSIPRRDALAQLEHNAKTLSEHVVKCCSYGDSLHCFDHWLREITNYISDASKIKSKSGKLKNSDYMSTFFKFCGDERSDASRELSSFIANHCTHFPTYPEFEVTNDLIDYVYKIFQSIESAFLPDLISGYMIPQQIVYTRLQEIFSTMNR